jgi:AcrR family transcriptional regulator
VLQAAIDSILEKGYYQTSSNEIARRAGVTWGAIQHQFGTREQLLLEVMNDRWHDLQEQVATARIQGATLEDRLAAVLEVLSTHYGEPASLAHTQIMLDLSHDPNTSKETREAVAIHGTRLVEAWEPLFAQALGAAANDFELVAFAFATLRGFLMGNLIATTIGAQASSRTQRRLLVSGVASALRLRAAEKGLELDD